MRSSTPNKRLILLGTLASLVALTLAASSHAADKPLPKLIEVPSLDKQVKDGKLPPIGERVPKQPNILDFAGTDKHPGVYGGELRMLGGRSRDTRLLYIYGGARLVRYAPDFTLIPDIAERIDVEEDRIFTIHLRKGHRWSDGAPFTSEDFRYYWEDFVKNDELSARGVDPVLLVDDEEPTVEFLDETTIRYSWSRPNPFFLAALAAPQALEIYKPSHYLKQFHASYVDKAEIDKMVEEKGQRNWRALHFSKDRTYRNDNVDLPSLQPWTLATEPPSERFKFKRNPYFHRIDTNGRQLPYIDNAVLTIASSELIPAKVGSGEADLQAAYVGFNNFAFLKQGEDRHNFTVKRWSPGKGSRIALFPNLTTNDPTWQALFLNADFRRALSLAINRSDVNQAIYYGLASESNNTLLPDSVLFKDEYRTKWTEFDPDMANKLLDGLGLTERDDDDIRLLPNGEPAQIIVETAGEGTEQTDVLELIGDNWKDVGIEMFIKPSQREVFKNRIESGDAQMVVWTGLENAHPTADTPPSELAPVSPYHYQWSDWGRHHVTDGESGSAPPEGPAADLVQYYDDWLHTSDPTERQEIWSKMLDIWTDQVFTIGIVSGVEQLVVVSNNLRNVPERGIYAWNPGSFMGLYQPDTFWFDNHSKPGPGKPKAPKG